MSTFASPGENPSIKRTRPDTRVIRVEPKHTALVVRRGEPGETLAPGEHRISGLLVPIPEVYLYRDEGQLLPLSISGLASCNGEPFRLGWRVQVKVVDVRKLWKAWLNAYEDDTIPLPIVQIGNAIADRTYELTRQFALNDLRGDAKVREYVAGRLSLFLRDELAPLGLALAAEFSPGALRVQTIADMAAAEKELRESRLDDTMDEFTNYDMLVHRLRETLDNYGVLLSEQKLAALTNRIVRKDVSMAQAIEEAIAHKDDVATTALSDRAQAVQSTFEATEPEADNQWRKIGSVGQAIAGLGLAVASFFAISSQLVPADVLAEESPWRRATIVAGIVAGSIAVAWLGTLFMQLAARNARDRLEDNAFIDVNEEVRNEVRWRNFAVILGSVAGISAVTAGFIVPDYATPARIVSSLLGVVASLAVVRWNYLYQLDRSLASLANSRRRFATIKFTRAQELRQYLQGLAELKTELHLLQEKVGEVASLAYWVLENQRTTGQLRLWEKTIDDLVNRIDQRPAPSGWDDRSALGDDAETIQRLGATLLHATKSADDLSLTMRRAHTAGIKTDAVSVQDGIDALVNALSHFRNDLIRSLLATR